MMCIDPTQEPRMRRKSEQDMIQQNGGQRIDTESADFYAEEDRENAKMQSARCSWIGALASVLGWVAIVMVAASLTGYIVESGLAAKALEILK